MYDASTVGGELCCVLKMLPMAVAMAPAVLIAPATPVPCGVGWTGAVAGGAVTAVVNLFPKRSQTMRPPSAMRITVAVFMVGSGEEGERRDGRAPLPSVG
jgi:hypothetical protein